MAANDAAATQRRIPMARLTDTQLIILSAASQRDDRGVELPANIKGEAARKVVDKLIRAGLLEEVRAVARSRSGDAMTTAELWRFASPRPASKRSMSRMRRRPLPRRQASALLPPTRSKHLHPKLLPSASGFPLRHRRGSDDCCHHACDPLAVPDSGSA
jgi:hypothetical protein